MNKPQPVKHKKVVVYIPEDEYKALRIRLFEAGKTVSGWFREVTRQLLAEPH